MGRLIVGVFALLLVANVSEANPVALLDAGRGAGASSDPSIDLILQQLNQTGKELKAFSAKVRLSESGALGDSTVRQGRVWFQKGPDGSARIHVLFNQRIEEQRQIAIPEKIEYLLEGPWLIDRNYQTKNEVKREVLKPGQKMDLFKLGEGPFPLPIGQEPGDVRRAFEIKRIATAKDDPAHAVHVQLRPKPGSDLARKFHSLDVWVDLQTHMPVRVDTDDVKQQTTRSTELSEIVLNPPGGLKDADFALPVIDNDHWNRHLDRLNP